MTPEQAAQLREAFPPELIGSLPRAGTQLSYVGHAAVTDRLLAVDTEWSWEPVAFDQYGAPLTLIRGSDSVLWIRLTIAGVTRLGVGIVASKSFELEKQLISDAIRNAAMRFGVALDLWSKEDLHGPADRDAEPPAPDPQPPSSNRVQNLKSRCIALQTAGISVAEHRQRHRLPVIDACDEHDLDQFEMMVGQLEQMLTAQKITDEKPPVLAEPKPDPALPPCDDDAADETEEQIRARVTEAVKALTPTKVLAELADAQIVAAGTPKANRDKLVDYRVWCALGTAVEEGGEVVAQPTLAG